MQMASWQMQLHTGSGKSPGKRQMSASGLDSLANGAQAYAFAPFRIESGAVVLDAYGIMCRFLANGAVAHFGAKTMAQTILHQW